MWIETLINESLSLDPSISGYVQQLNEKIIKINCITLGKTFFVSFLENKFYMTESESAPVQATIQGPLRAFMHLAFTKDPRAAMRLGLEFEGDPDVLHAFQELFLSLKVDWEELLSQRTGDMFAHTVGSFVKSAKQKKDKLFKRGAESLSQYLKAESLLLPTQQEVETFMNEVDDIRAAADRLEARFEKLL